MLQLLRCMDNKMEKKPTGNTQSCFPILLPHIQKDIAEIVTQEIY